MIKPIVYHDISEKKKLEAKLFSAIPMEKRKAVSREFIDFFLSLGDLHTGQKDVGASQKFLKINGKR